MNKVKIPYLPQYESELDVFKDVEELLGNLISSFASSRLTRMTGCAVIVNGVEKMLTLYNVEGDIKYKLEIPSKLVRSRN